MNIQVFSNSYVVFENYPNRSCFVIDPADQWEKIKHFLDENQVALKWILLTEVTFEKAAYISQIKQETGASLLSFRSDLLKLRMLQTWANQKNVCGIKIPHVDRFLDDEKEVVIDGIPLQIKVSEGIRQYTIGTHIVPPRKL